MKGAQEKEKRSVPKREKSVKKGREESNNKTVVNLVKDLNRGVHVCAMASRLKRRSSVHRAHPMDGLSGTAAGSGAPGAGSGNDSFDERPSEMVAPPEDEERERRARRGAHKRQSMGHVAHGAGSAAAAAAVASPGLEGTPSGGHQPQSAVYSNAQLAEIYDHCIRLSAENKINPKNAFQLKMIDYMAEMVKKKKSDMDNFQAASCALDASTKIYAYRVDSVHTETLKLASGVGSNKADKEEAGAGEDGEDGGADDQDAKKKRKKRKRATMVEKNLANINCSKFELEFDVDPLFKKVSAQFDSGGGGGQFLSNLRMRDDGCELLLDSRASASAGPSAAAGKSTEEVEVEEAHLPKISDDLLICPTFADFSFRGWSLEKEESMLKSQESAAKDQGGDGGGGLAENDEHVFDPDALPNNQFADDDGGIFGGDDFGDDGAGEDGAGGGGGGAGYNPMMGRNVTMALMDVKNLRDHLSAVPTEYSYFDTGRIGAWAGPKHWKFKPMHRLPAGDDDKKKRQKKDKEKINFEELDDGNKLLQDFVQKAMTVPKKAIKLQNKTMLSWGDEKNALPEDMNYSGKEFVKLESMIKSNVAPRRRLASESQSVDDTVEDYNFDNPNDTQNFCPGLNADTENYPPNETTKGTTGDDFSQGISGLGEATAGGEEDGGGLGLIAAPNKVEKIQIGYAKLAKKIDMRKLKTVEWDILNESVLGMDKENSKDFNKTAPADESKNGSTVLSQKGSTSFREMYNLLLGPSQLPSKMKENLSVPLAFVALLHLCNEQVLELSNENGLDNLLIRKA